MIAEWKSKQHWSRIVCKFKKWKHDHPFVNCIINLVNNAIFSNVFQKRMAVTEVFNLVNKKKRLKVEPFILKYHSRLLLISSMVIACTLFACQNKYGAIHCSTDGTGASVEELNKLCIARVYNASQHKRQTICGKSYFPGILS